MILSAGIRVARVSIHAAFFRLTSRSEVRMSAVRQKKLLPKRGISGTASQRLDYPLDPLPPHFYVAEKSTQAVRLPLLSAKATKPNLRGDPNALPSSKRELPGQGPCAW